jgi:hypothetical protein
MSAAKHRAAQLSETAHADTRDFVSRIVQKIIVEKNELCMVLSGAQLYKSFLGDVRPGDSPVDIELREPISFARRGSEVKLILSNGECKSGAPIASLVRAVVQARTWSDWIVSGDVKNLEQLAAKAGLNKRYASRILRLAALSPTLCEAILSGNHSPLVTLLALTKSLPLSWDHARNMRGIRLPHIKCCLSVAIGIPPDSGRRHGGGDVVSEDRRRFLKEAGDEGDHRKSASNLPECQIPSKAIRLHGKAGLFLLAESARRS